MAPDTTVNPPAVDNRPCPEVSAPTFDRVDRSWSCGGCLGPIFYEDGPGWPQDSPGWSHLGPSSRPSFVFVPTGVDNVGAWIHADGRLGGYGTYPPGDGAGWSPYRRAALAEASAPGRDR